MQFVFVGDDSEWRWVQNWLIRSTANPTAAAVPHEWVVLSPATDDNLWKLLATGSGEAIVLGGDTSSRTRFLREIVQAGRHVLCLTIGDLGPIFCHEIAILARDAKSAIVPVLPGRQHPAWRELVSTIRSGKVGTVRDVKIACAIPATPDNSDMSQTTLQCYAESVDLLYSLIGDIVELTAAGEQAAARVTVHHRSAAGATGEIRILPQLAGINPGGVTVDGLADNGEFSVNWTNGLLCEAKLRWSIFAAPQSPAGDAAVAISGNPVGDQTSESVIAANESSQVVLGPFESAIAGSGHSPTWQDAIRAVELTECMRQSLTRRRTIDVYNEARGEEASFKGAMTSLGCGLIWITLLCVLVIAIGKGLGIPGMDLVGIGMVAVWAVFLGMQSLRWIVPSQSKSTK